MLAEIPVAPEIPALGALVVSMGLLLCWVSAYGIQVVWRRSLGALLLWIADKLDTVSLFGHHLFGPLTSILRSLKSTVDHYLGEAVLWSEKGAATFFKFFLNINLWMAREIADLAHDVLHGFQRVETNVIRPAVKVLDVKTQATVKRLGATLATLDRVTVPALRHSIAALRADFARFSHAVAGTLAHPIPALGRVERDVANQAKRLKRLNWLTKYASLAALGAAILARLGLSSLRCSRTQKWNKGMCSSPYGWLEDILAGAILLAGTLSVVDFVKAAQTFEDEAVEALRLAVKEFPGH